MHKLYLLLALPFMFTNAFAAASCQKDSAEILKRVHAMNTAFENGDAETLVDMTDPVLFERRGGKEVLLIASKQALEQMKESGMEIEKSVIGKPTKTYMADTKSVCFVPKDVIMNIDGKRARSVGYLVAINRNTPDSPWLFLDSSGFQKNPELLWTLIPGLPKNIKLPPNKIKLIEGN